MKSPGSLFQLQAPFSPCGDQPSAIKQLSLGVKNNIPAQVLLGATGSGKTFTIANVIANAGRPTLVLAHNKTLAAQLYQELKNFFPDNAVEYFISYYDYYQPEAYIARNDTYIEKSLLINDEIDKLRLAATRSLLERRDTIIVSSVSCIYGIGDPQNYAAMALQLHVDHEYPRHQLIHDLVTRHYAATQVPQRSAFREKGRVIDIFPASDASLAIRLEFAEDVLVSIEYTDPITMMPKSSVSSIILYPGSLYVSPENVRSQAIASIKAELLERIAFYEQQERFTERDRINHRTIHDLEMIKETGFCKGIENYSRHFTGAAPGEPPKCLLDYFPKDFLFIIDESHQTLPQIRSMYKGDRVRKQSLVEYGFRLPSAYDNRPLTYDEARKYFRTVIYVSATPGDTELLESQGHVAEQVIRPTGIPDPLPEIRPAHQQINDLLEEIRMRLARNNNEKIFVISTTKKLAEEVANFLSQLNIAATYLHSDIKTAERTQILKDLRSGAIDVLIGVNLLREGLDIPEITLVAILDADKEGFLRSTSSLIQFCGRAARNVHGSVIFYADHVTSSMHRALQEIERRRSIQISYNQEHNITPRSVQKNIADNPIPEKKRQEEPTEVLTGKSVEELEQLAQYYERQMQQAAEAYQFEDAAHYRNSIEAIKQLLLSM